MTIQPIHINWVTLFCLFWIPIPVQASCTFLICESNAIIWINNDCNTAINPHDLIVNQNQYSKPKEQGSFNSTNWTITTNGAGGVDVTGAPDTVLVQGTNTSPFNMTPRYMMIFKIVISAERFISFDWNNYGGSIFKTNYFTDTFSLYHFKNQKK